MTGEAKRDFFAVYDYGSGGVWAVFKARSAAEIVDKYPDLHIVEMRPQWMNDDIFETIAANRSFDIDDAPKDWLLGLSQRHSQ